MSRSNSLFRRFIEVALPIAILFPTIIPVVAQTAHTDAYNFGLRIQDSIQKEDIALFAQVFDPDAMLDRTLNPLQIAPDLRQVIKQSARARLSPRTVAESVARSAKNLAFVGVRHLYGENQLLYRCEDARKTITYYGFALGKGPAGQMRLVDVYFFAPGEYMSETARRGALVSLAALAGVDERKKNLIVQGLDEKQKDFIAAQSLWESFLNRCKSGHYALAFQAYGKLPPSLQTDKFVLFNRATAAIHEDEPIFLDAIAPWRRSYPDDAVLEMLVSDFYWERADDRKAIAAFEKLNELLGGDPELDLRIAKAHQGLHESKQAMDSLWQAARRDPPLASAFAALLKETVAQKSFEQTARALALKEAMFDKDIKEEVKADSSLAEFRKSPAYQAWMKAPREQLKPAATETVAGGDAMKLQAILFSPARPSATINGKTLFIGDEIGAYKVAQIEPQRVTLRSAAGDTSVLTLKR